MRGQSRRQLIQGGLGLAGVGLLAGCGRAPVRRLWGSGPRRIGYLSLGSVASSEVNLAAFRAGLADLGYVEGRDVTLEARYENGRAETLPALAAELVALPVEVILTDAYRGIRPIQQVSPTIPVVFTTADDPVADGYVDSMARPGGSLTGLTMEAGQQEGRRLQLLREVAPSMTHVALLSNAAGLQPGRARQIEAAAQVLGVQVVPLLLDRPDDLDLMMTGTLARRAQGLIMLGAAAFLAPLVPRIVELAARNRWPSVSATPSVARVGGLLGYGPNIPDLYRRAAGYVDKILRGANPGELPIERPAKFEFVVNLKTARAIGVTVPVSMLAQATEVVQ